jgi:hypothetical protein
MKQLKTYLTLGVAALALAVGAAAHAANPIISIDEFGSGFLDFRSQGGLLELLTGVLQNDPGPGGLSSVMTYDMLGPPSVTAGDVLFADDDAGGAILDVIRFNNYNTGDTPGYPASILFYSDNIDGFDSPADTFGPPSQFYANIVTIHEDLNGFASYHPAEGAPGFVPGFDVVYRFFSDGNANAGVPEPASWALLIVGFAGVGASLRLRKPATA